MTDKVCSVAECERTNQMTAGYCGAHYARVRAYGDPRADVPVRRRYGGETCSVEICSRSAAINGLCRAHNLRRRLTGDVQAHLPLAPRLVACSIDECEEPARGRRLCNTHYERWRRHGDPAWQPAPFVPQPRINSQGYAQIRVNGRYVAMHRYVWEREHGPLLPGQTVHHRNGDRADNRISNLELWDQSQPAGQRPEDKVEFAVDMLRRYAPHLLKEAAP